MESTGEKPSVEDKAQEEPSYTEKEREEAHQYWARLAAAKDWEQVRHDLKVYECSGANVTEDPRRSKEYREEVLKGLGFGANWKEKRPDLDEATVAAVAEVLSRKAAGFWLPETPRTTVQHVKHDTVPTGPPVKQPPHNLKGEAAEWVDEALQKEVDRGLLERGTSPWGSPPFPTKEFPDHRRQRKRRLVIDYRRVNARTMRSVYYVRDIDGVISTAAGSVWLTMLDAVTGFNHIVNTRRAKEMLAIVARCGQFLPRCLTFGPHNGPEDFCYVIDRFYSAGRSGKRRFCKEWLGYVDDLTIRTGRVLDGVFYTDEEAEARVSVAAKKAVRDRYQDVKEALEAQGFDVKGLGSELKIIAPGLGSSTRNRSVAKRVRFKVDDAVRDVNHPWRKGMGSFL